MGAADVQLLIKRHGSSERVCFPALHTHLITHYAIIHHFSFLSHDTEQSFISYLVFIFYIIFSSSSYLHLLCKLDEHYQTRPLQDLHIHTRFHPVVVLQNIFFHAIIYPIIFLDHCKQQNSCSRFQICRRCNYDHQ